MKDLFKDITRIAGGFKFDAVKVSATAEATTFEAFTTDRTVIIKGVAKTPVTDIQGTFGLSNLSTLSGILGLSAMKDENSKITVVEEKGDPKELVFSAPGMKAVYRLMADSAVPKQPNFKASQFDIEVETTKQSVFGFDEQASIFSSVSPKFVPSASNGNLVFSISAGATSSSTEYIFADVPPTAKLSGGYMYPIAEVMKALKLVSTGTCKAKFTSLGAMVVEVDTGISEITFIFPGHSQ